MENLRAVILQGNTTKILSYEEFQEKLNLWFHEKGVLTELKLHLRFKLISLLKYTTIGRGIIENNSQSTLSNQALNLIVAEYLIQNKCYYSLSIFNTETTFTSVPLDYPIYFNEEKQNEFYSVYLDRENILKILDLIGLTKNNPLYDKLLSIYFKTQKNKSILSCLIDLICQLPKATIEASDGKISKILHAMLVDNSSKINFVKKIEELLTHTNLPSHYVTKVSQNISLFYETKRRRQKNELLDIINQLKTEVTSKDKTIKKLQKSKQILYDQLLKSNKNYGKAKLQLENLSNEVVLRQSKQIECLKLKNDDSKDTLRQISLPVPKVENKITCQLSHCDQVCRENIKLIENFQNETEILKKENREQKDLLQKLFLMYKDLLYKFENGQIKLNFFNSTVSKEFTEELIENYLPGDDLEVEVPHYIVDSEVSTNNRTEEILNQARTKLQTLEDETKELEDKFKNFHYN